MDASQNQSQNQNQRGILKKRICSGVPLKISVIIIGGLQVVLNVGEIICGIYDAQASELRLMFAFGIASVVVSSFALLLGILLLVGILKHNLLLVKVWQCMVLFVVVLDLVMAGYVIFLLITYSVAPLYIIWLCISFIFIAVVGVGLFVVNSYIAVKLAEKEEEQRAAENETRFQREKEREMSIKRMRR